MADYKLNGNDDSNGVIRRIDSAGIPNEPGNRDWQEYLEWVDLGGIPDPQYTLAEGKIICAAYARKQYDDAVAQPYNDGTDDILLDINGRAKMYQARGTTKSILKIKKADGKPKSLTVTELEDLMDAIDDRDDSLLDNLESALDAIDDAETLEDLDGYWPPT